MTAGTAKAIEVAERDLESARRAVRQCEHNLARAKEVAREAGERLKALRGKPAKAAS